MEQRKLKCIIDESIYYDGNNMLSYNSLYNYVVGGRGVGKTFWGKKHVIKKFLKDGSQFVYLRRYDSELDERSKFFADIKKSFPDHKFTVKGYEFFIDGKAAGFCMCLTKGLTKKSTPYPDVETILFDEFLIDTVNTCYRYLKNEVKQFLELYDTIVRLRDIRVIFFANNVSLTNPYFLHWGVYTLNIKKEFHKFKDNEILIQFPQCETYKEVKRKTRFGKLNIGTTYGDYAIENKSLIDNNDFIAKRTGKAFFQFSIVYEGIKYGIWCDYSIGKMYVSYKCDPSLNISYVLKQTDHTVNTLLLNSNSKILKNFAKNFQMGNVLFENTDVKNRMYGALKLIM